MSIRWLFSRRRRAALEAWTVWSSPGRPMPVEFEAGFHLGFGACRRAVEAATECSERET